MWETIRDVLMSPNVTVILVFLAFVFVLAIVLSKTGLLNIHTNVVQIGAAIQERNIIRQQIEWVKLHCEGMESQLPKAEGYNTWRGRYIAERVFDEYVSWITFNHLSTDSTYVEIKQDRIVNLVESLVEREEFKTKEFEKMLRDDTREALEKLVQIREVYK